MGRIQRNDELKEIDMKNWTCYYLYYIIKIEDFDFDNIFNDEKSHENILVCDISYKTFLGKKPLRIRFDKISCVLVYDGNRYSIIFGPEKYDAIYSRIRHLISQKSGITYVISHNCARVKVDSYDSLPSLILCF